MTLEQLYIALLVGALVILVGIGATRLATRIGLPSLLLYLLIGMLLGEAVLGIDFSDARLAEDLGTAALAVILVEGGLTTKWSEIRSVVAPAGVLATLGVGISTVVTATGAHFLVGLHWQAALLLGAIVASTDAAAVFAVLRVLPLPRRVAGLLEAESGFNDAPAVILVLILIEVPFDLDAGGVLASLSYELVAGAVIGIGAGWLGSVALRRIAFPASGLTPLAAFGIGVAAFAAAGAAHASGFLAAYLSALVMANAGLPHRAATRSFAEGIAWLAQIGLFVLLGLLISPEHLPDQIVPAIVVGLVLLLAARPLAVLCSLSPFRVPWREQAFMSWAGLRGAVPIVLATFPVVHGLSQSERILNIVFVLVVIYTLIQGPSLAPLARVLRLAPRESTRQILVESAPLDVRDAELLTMTVPTDSGLNGVSIVELRLPDPSVVTLVIRGERSFVPTPDTRLQADDELLVITTRRQRDNAERRLRAVNRRGPLAHWFGEYGQPD